MRPHLYILDDKGEPLALNGDIREMDLTEWGKFMENAKRHVGDETIDGIRISTVFLGLDHNFSDEGPAVLWESMLFCKEGNHPLHNDCLRCSGSREQAEAMHKRMVEKVKNFQPA